MEIIERHNKFIFIFLVLVSGFLLFWKLGSNTLTNWDEAWYADISRNMYSSGNIITPVWNKEPFFDKPPLYFWLTVPILKIFGISEFSFRFMSSLSALATGVVLYFLAKLLFNKKIALFSFIILNSTVAFLYRSRTGNLDALLTFSILLSIYSFYKGLLGKNKKWFLIMGISTGLCFLTKGFIAYFFPIIAVCYLFLTRNFKILKSKNFILGFLLSFLISFSWLAASILINKGEFTSGFFSNQSEKINIAYFWHNFSFEYLAHLKSGLKFWFILFIPSLIYVFYKWRKGNLSVLLVYFILFILILFFSENKSNWFLMPLYPLIALIIAFAMERMKFKFISNKFYLILFILITIASCQDFKYRKEFIVPDISIDERNVALAAKNITPENENIYLTNYYYPTIVFYSQRKVYAVYSERQKNSWWIKPKTDWINILTKNNVVIITSEQELKKLQDEFKQYKFKIEYKSGDKILIKKV